MAAQPSSSGGGRSDPISRYPVVARPLLARMAARHAPTYQHQGRVSRIAEAFATDLRLSRREVRMVSLSALLHDIGKLEIPGAVLTKAGPLTPEEVELVCEHPARGAAILARYPALAHLAVVVRHHHEWFDGRGYPDGLKGEEIPWLSRLIAICDAFDCMTTPRPYAPPLSVEQALDEIRRGTGTQFDPELARQFLERHRRVLVVHPRYPTEWTDPEQRPRPLAVRARGRT
ncbi:MAG: HD-GYP domain-containing protein [Symbiobacterium sp.]|uniref:HD-GYP domain-containing protein n=1 Tax=Symbiobacterium sp. TaxID=1971213 RepID=UPI003463A56C